MTTPLLNVILIGVVSLVAFDIIIYWHRNTKGTWREWPAGRSLMYLLSIIALGFGYGVINQFLGQYAARPFVGFLLYMAFIGALIVIRFTIRSELRRGKSRLKDKFPLHTGPIDVVVGEEKEADNG